MSSRREVTVVINGEEHVSAATSAADNAVGGFIGKIPGWAKLVGVLTVAYQVVSQAIGAVKDYVLDSIDAYDRFASSQTKLAAQSKLTGVSMQELNRLADEGRDKFGLSSVTANDLATTVAKYASRAGEAAKANELMARALDLGAASGLDAAASMEALEQGLRGQDEGFDKLLGKNPSAIWKEYADANDLAVGKMTDTQKRMAELTAIVEAGTVVQGAYNDRIESGAGAQDRLSNKVDEAKVAFGQAIQPLRIFVVQGLTTLVDVGGRVVLAIGRVANAIGVVLTGAVELARSIVGGFTVVVGKLTGNKELEDWGHRQAAAFGDFQAQLARLEKKYLDTGTAATDSATTQAAAAKKVGDSITQVTETATQQMARLDREVTQKLGEPMRVAIGLTEGALRKLGDAARDQLPPEKAEQFAAHMQTLTERAEEARQRMLGLGEQTGKAKDTTRDTARQVESIARAGLDAAEAFGVINSHAARTLDSAINIATAIGRMAAGDLFGGGASFVAAIANIVSQMMAGDAERRRLLKENNQALAKLSRDIGGLKLNITEQDMNAARIALGSVIPRLSGGRGAANETDIREALEAQGLTMGDLDRIAKELGITIRTSSGAINVEAIKQLFAAMGTTRLGRMGSNFEEQFDFFQESQRIEGTSGANAIQGVLDFLRNVGGVTALNGLNASDPTALRASLRNLFTRLNNGEGVQGLGRLTGSQFMNIILSLIGDIDSVLQSSGVGDVNAPAGTGGTGGTGGSSGPTVPPETIQEVIKAMDTNLGELLTTHTAIHERIAVATESSATSLQSIDGKMDALIAATASQAAAVDARFAAIRSVSLLTAGVGPEF